MEIRLLRREELAAAQALVFEVFDDFVAPDFTAEGAAAFRAYVAHEGAALSLIGAFVGGEMVGILATDAAMCQVVLFFVRAKAQRHGIGRALWQWLLAHSAAAEIRVHASPFAVPVYERLGFVATGPEQEADGMRFTPMVAERSRDDARETGV